MDFAQLEKKVSRLNQPFFLSSSDLNNPSFFLFRFNLIIYCTHSKVSNAPTLLSSRTMSWKFEVTTSIMQACDDKHSWDLAFLDVKRLVRFPAMKANTNSAGHREKESRCQHECTKTVFNLETFQD